MIKLMISGQTRTRRGCGPCQLCGKSAPSTSVSAKLKSRKQSGIMTVFVCACEKNIKRKIHSENYIPRWVSSGMKCILPNRTRIVHSGLVTAEHNYQFSVAVHTEGKLVPL